MVRAKYAAQLVLRSYSQHLLRKPLAPSRSQRHGITASINTLSFSFFYIKEIA